MSLVDASSEEGALLGVDWVNTTYTYRASAPCRLPKWLTDLKYPPLSLVMYNNAGYPTGPSTPLLYIPFVAYENHSQVAVYIQETLYENRSQLAIHIQEFEYIVCLSVYWGTCLDLVFFTVFAGYTSCHWILYMYITTRAIILR